MFIVVVRVDIPGGTTRTKLVINGLNSLNNKMERVVIVEAARPLVIQEQIKILLKNENVSITFVIPMVHIAIMRNGTYLNRNEMYELFTSQGLYNFY